MTEFLSFALFPTLMIIAGAGDALSMRIPNWLTGLLALLFFPMAFLTGMPWADFGMHVAVGAALFFAGFALFSLRLFGGGDAKLLAAAGMWLGWPDLMPFLVLTAFAGGVLAFCIMAWSAINQSSEINEGALFRRLGSIRPDVPYGFAFAIGAILAFQHSWWMPAAS